MALTIELHKNIMVQILKAIYSDDLAGPALGFKGGTAALLFYNLDRFSVDLDFDLLDSIQEKAVFARVGKIIAKFGQLKDLTTKHFTLFGLVSYASGERNIKIEINRQSAMARYEVKNYLGVSMLVMAQEDMFANKLLAMYERMGRASRDIFDVWFFFKNNWPVNKKIVEARSGMKYGDFLLACVNKLEKLDSQKILSGLGELLTNKQKIWAKANLIKDAIFFLKLQLEALK